MSNFISLIKRITVVVLLSTSSIITWAHRIEPILYGDFNQWITRDIHESVIIGGDHKNVYEIGPTATIEGNKAYVPRGGSPWATSNVYARVSGVTKTSNCVFPYERSAGNYAAKLCSMMETVKALGIIKMDVMVAGSIFLGRMFEPITSTKNPYSKMEMGVPFTKRPEALVFDYKIDMPSTDTRTYSSGFGSKRTIAGRDTPVAFVMLQRRWEDSNGNLHARRVATGGEVFRHSADWTNAHHIKLIYGDTSSHPELAWLPLRDKAHAYYARNSKGEMKPVVEEGFDSPDATPTHLIVMFSSGNGEPYTATPGVTFYVDNVGLEF